MTMSESSEARHIYKDSDPKLYEHLEDMSEASVGTVEIDGKAYNLAKDVDENSVAYFILVPIG